MSKGIALVLMACVVWGFIFVIPELLIGFSPIEVALGRYFFFGLISLCFMLVQGVKKWLAIPPFIWKQALNYALIVNVLYYFSLVLGLRYSNAAVITLLLGMSPITLAFYGNWQHKECSFRKLIFPSVLIGGGLLLVNYPAFNAHSVTTPLHYLFGLGCGLLSLIAWNWYVLSNAKFLKQNPQLPSSDWATLIGAGTFVWVVLIGGAALFFADPETLKKYVVLNDALERFLIGSFILGFCCSWIGAYLWNRGSQDLPLSLAGQLTIFETIFGLIYVYIAQQRFPSSLETAGITVILSGVALSMQIFRKASNQSLDPDYHPNLT